MPLPSQSFAPPFNIVRLSHVELGVADLARSREFYVDTLVLQVTHEDANVIYLRTQEERGHHCMILRKSATASVEVLGFNIWSDENLDRAEHWFRAKGLPVACVERAFMGRVLRTRDPWGSPPEFYAQMVRLPPIHQQYKLYHGAKPLRIDHFSMFSADVDASVGFYAEMGFRLTEYTVHGASGRIRVAWMQRKGGVHDVAFPDGTGPRLHHTAFWVPTSLNIIDQGLSP
jgi:catechol 2,3-dioxygenase